MKGFQINLVTVRRCEFFTGEANGVLGDGGVLCSVGAPGKVGPRCVNKWMVLFCGEPMFVAVEGREDNRRERRALFRDEADVDWAVGGFKSGAGAASGAKFPPHLGDQPRGEEEGCGFVLGVVVDGDFLQVPQKGRGSRLVKREGERSTKS